MTDDRSPFRRFPWVQLAFCLACLTMTAWTWMRYSVSRVVTLERLQDGILVCPERTGRLRDGDYVLFAASDIPTVDKPHCCRAHSGLVLDVEGDLYSHGTDAMLSGRVDVTSEEGGSLTVPASRFHPASVAGIVVGAMGCFIFGLYLRAWLRERKAAA